MNNYSGSFYFAKIEKAAEKIRARNPQLTKEQAIAQATEELPHIRAAYSDEIKRDIQKGGR